jgi:FkbM family methyltransferase
MNITKVLVNLLCCFIPNPRKRKEIRKKLVKSKERRKKLLGYGCVIEGDIVCTKEKIRFDISDYAKACAHIEEIIVNDTYNLSFKDNSVVIDIGMNRAISSLFFAAKENVKKIYAFEPFEPTLMLAKKNLAHNPELDKKIKTFTYGLGKEDTILEIPYSIDLSDCMSTTHPISVRQNVQTETVTVKDAAKILAPIFEKEKNNRIVIKCDCEGAEFEILERLNEENLVGKMDAVLMEYHFQKPDRLVEIFIENGFAVHVKYGLKKEPIAGYLYAVKMQQMT